MMLDRIFEYFKQGDALSIRYKVNTVYMFILKGISILISLLYVPLLLHTLDTENYGIWLTLTSIVSWVAMMDIGLGNGLRNKLAEALANNNILLAKKYISSAYVALFIYILIFLLIFLIAIFNFVPWNNVLNAPNIPEHDLNALVLVVFLSFAIQFVLNLINSVLLALQSPAISSLLTTLGQLLSFISVLICVKLFNIHSLVILGSIVSFSPSLVLLLASILLFAGKYKELRPSIRYFDRTLIKDIVRLGISFFIIQIITIILYQSNNIIITHVVGNEGVVEYNIANKYFQVLYMLYMIIVTPMWSATTQAYAVRDFQWIKNTAKQLNKIAIVFSVCGGVMLLLSPIAYKIWMGEVNLIIQFSTSLLLYISEVFRMFYGHYGYIINGTGRLNAQLVITGLLTLVYIPLAIILGKKIGLAGILFMNMCVNLVNFIWSKYQYKLIVSERAEGFWNK